MYLMGKKLNFAQIHIISTPEPSCSNILWVSQAAMQTCPRAKLTLWLNMSVSCLSVVYCPRCFLITSIRSTSSLSSSYKYKKFKNNVITKFSDSYWSLIEQANHLTRLVVTISSNHLDWHWLYRSTHRIRSSPVVRNYIHYWFITF